LVETKLHERRAQRIAAGRDAFGRISFK
jgi:hypothetical protein